MNVKEIFFSYQAEGKYIGTPTIFLRFAGCNLSCYYCDTKYAKVVSKKTQKSIDWIEHRIKNYLRRYDVRFISFTGGEPLLQKELFKLLDRLKSLKRRYKIKFYLETNASLVENFKKIIDFIDVICISLKLYVDDLNKINTLNNAKKFVSLCKKNRKEFFVKLVVSENLYDNNLLKDIVDFVKFTKTKLIILQPETKAYRRGNKNVFLNTSNIYRKLHKFVPQIHIIPQLHKFLWKIK